MSLLQCAMELLQIATAKFIIKCDKVYCKLRHMLQSAPGGGAIIIANCDNTERPSSSACLTVRQSLVSILKRIGEILYPIKWWILKRTATWKSCSVISETILSTKVVTFFYLLGISWAKNISKSFLFSSRPTLWNVIFSFWGLNMS